MVTWMWLIFWFIHIILIPIWGICATTIGWDRVKGISAWLIFCLLVYLLLRLNV